MLTAYDDAQLSLLQIESQTPLPSALHCPSLKTVGSSAPHVATHSGNQDRDHDDDLDVDGSELHLPTVMSPIRNASGGHTSVIYNSSHDTSATLSTPDASIMLGPQATPFVIRRRFNVDGDAFLKGPPNTPNSTCHPDVTSKLDVIRIRHPDGSIEEVEDTVHVPQGPVSTWRKEQVKYMRKGRMSKNPERKRIPMMHGSLSLPYARNPR